jgi:hypothetical protein
MSARASFDDALTITRGRHTFKFGFSTEIDHKTEPCSANYMGNFAFNDDVNNRSACADGYANMLIGDFTTYTGADCPRRQSGAALADGWVRAGQLARDAADDDRLRAPDPALRPAV